MIDLKRIYPECDADTFLVQLILQRGLPTHCKGIHKVAASLEKFADNTLFVVGLIDHDKANKLPTYITRFRVVEDRTDSESLTILHLPGTKKYLLKLKPAFEKWILAAAKSSDIAHTEYGFNTFEQFKTAAKDDNVYDNKNMKKFINAVILANPPAIQTLRHWLNKATTEN